MPYRTQDASRLSARICVKTSRHRRFENIHGWLLVNVGEGESASGSGTIYYMHSFVHSVGAAEKKHTTS